MHDQNAPALLVALLDAAGYDLRRHRDGVSWVATHADSGQQVEGETPEAAALAALALLRQQRHGLAAQLRQIAAELGQAADRAEG